jgi:DNA-binding PadR family transcriptional regulator
MSLRHALLGALADQPRTGYSLLKHFQGSLAYAWPAGHSQIYPELARLRDEGLIRQASTGPRGSKTYELTDKGLDEIRRWLREEDPDRTVRNEAALRIFFLWLLEPKEAAEYLDREAEYQRSLLEELEAIAAEQSPPGRAKEKAFRVALEWGLKVTRARLDWARWAAKQYRR